MKAKRLIEVALPVKEISTESVRDKTIHHGHISTLHPWWARRPLPTCRAIVFASLVPDPLDNNCPQAFKDAILCILNPEDDKIVQYQYKPYADIPYTAILDPMEDNLRNRLMMFIGKFSDKAQKNMLAGKTTSPKEQLDEGSLIKWENKNNSRILRMARELIWVAYNSEKNPEIGYETHHKNFIKAYDAIKVAEDNLYEVVDRHIKTSETEDLETALQTAIDDFLCQMPSVFDPFAGGGAIPLEAARLGCRSFGNDINPVAHIIEKGSAEFPQKFGKPICYTESEFLNRYGDKGLTIFNERKLVKDTRGFYLIPNRLAFDVEFYVKQILASAEEEVGHLYPKDKNGNKPIAYYWVRTAKCSNPSCGANVPMLKGFDLANTSSAKVSLVPHIQGTQINFTIQNKKSTEKGWNNRGVITCPCCGAITSIENIKSQSCSNGLHPRLLAIITENNVGKNYFVPTKEEEAIITQKLGNIEKPIGKMHRNSGGGDTFAWGFTNWADLFSERQLYVLNAFVRVYHEVTSTLPTDNYGTALKTMLALWLDRVVLLCTSFGRWSPNVAAIVHLFGRQAIAMTADYPESNPFCSSSGSGLNQLDWVLRYIESESSSPFIASFLNASSGEKTQFDPKSLSAVVTDPPYYDAIAYADISDFFYIWLKQLIGEEFALHFSTPQTPKSEECTALKHHHDGDEEKAKKHFENKLTEIFDAIEMQTSDIVSIMFAHQSTEAWSTLCNSILAARMNITGSWPIDTEREVRMLALAGAALESSVTVACRPSERKGYGDYKSVKKDIERKVAEEVESLYELGFRGADLLTACFGQAVSEFGKYKSVEKSDGSEVTVAELLEMARNAAFNALLKGVQGDDFTKFYIGWLQLNGTGETDFDDATKFTRVGVNVNIKDIQQEGLLILEGKKMHIAMADEHIGGSSVEGTRPEDSPISQAHRFILLNKEEDRGRILRFVRDICPEASSPLWRLLATLKELLPANDDQKQVVSILQNAEDFRQHCHEDYKPKEGNLFDNMDI